MEKIAIRYRRFPLGLTWTTLYFFRYFKLLKDLKPTQMLSRAFTEKYAIDFRIDYKL